MHTSVFSFYPFTDLLKSFLSKSLHFIKDLKPGRELTICLHFVYAYLCLSMHLLALNGRDIKKSKDAFFPVSLQNKIRGKPNACDVQWCTEPLKARKTKETQLASFYFINDISKI